MIDGTEVAVDQFARVRVEFEKIIWDMKRSTVRQLWIACGVFLLLIAALATAALLLIPASTLDTLRSGSLPQGTGETEFLKLFVPLFIVAFGFLVGLLGLKRLEQFDDEINRLRSALAEQLLEERKLIAMDRASFREDFEARVGTIREDIKAVAETHVANAFDARKEGLIEKAADFERSTAALIKRISEGLSPYAWLEERKEEVDYLTGIYTIGVAHDRVTDFFSQRKFDMALRIAEHAVKSTLPGTPEDFHNLASELGSNDQEALAMQVVENGLKTYPDDVDLLANGMKFGSSVGLLTRAEEFYRRLRAIDPRYWNWRAFVFAGDYLQAAARIDDAMSIYELFRKQLPEDERAYSSPGAYFAKLGRYDEAEKILEAGLAKCRWCPQTAGILSRIYKEMGEYEKAIATADRGIEANAADQPSINQSGLLWRRAEAQDALIHRLIQERLKHDSTWSVDDDVLDRAQECITDYRTSLNMTDTTDFYQRRGPERLRILMALLRKNGASDERLSHLFALQMKSAEPSA